jgi:carboxyl-terminal processing protease
MLRPQFLAVAALLISLCPSSARADSDNDSIYRELKTFTDVLAIVQRDYVQDVPGKKLVEGAIRGMLSNLDPHSGYMDPDFYKDLQVETKGEFGGLGIEITVRDGTLIVVSPMEGSPAEAAGVKAGDAIVKINGNFAKEYSLIDAVKLLRGPKGSEVVLSLARKGSPDLVNVKVIRDNILLKSVRSRYLKDGFGYVRISQFAEHTSDDLQAALASIRKAAGSGGIKGLILDLRNNPGGLLTQAVSVSDLFLKEGIIVYTDGRVESQKQKFFAHPRGTEPDYPLVVVVNGGSASASEIVSGALRDHGRALILGTQTFGKGSVQTILPLENGGALRLTTALYYTKSGRSIQLAGVTPDVIVDDGVSKEVEMAAAEALGKKLNQSIRERDYPGAIDPKLGKNQKGNDDQNTNLSTALDIPKKVDIASIPLDDWMKSDAQLARAFELLRTFDVFSTGVFASRAAENSEAKVSSN